MVVEHLKSISCIGAGFHHQASTNPLRSPKSFSWNNNSTELNIYFDKHIEKDCNSEKINFGWLLESPIVLKELGVYDYLFNKIDHLKSKFINIFTNDKLLLNDDDNFFQYIQSDILPWIKQENYNIYPKTKFCSIIASCQKKHPGHILRHEIMDKYSFIDHFGFGHQNSLSIDDTYLGFKDYLFSFCIENCQNPGYWGVKLTNAIACGTVPIYWGDPQIFEIFNPKGFIFIDDKFDLNKVTEKDYYQRMVYIKENMEILKNLELPEDKLYKKYLQHYL